MLVCLLSKLNEVQQQSVQVALNFNSFPIKTPTSDLFFIKLRVYIASDIVLVG